MTAEVSMEFMTGNPQLGVLSGRLTYLGDERKAVSTSPSVHRAAAGDELRGKKEEAKSKAFDAARLNLIDIQLPKRRETLLCILSVPAHMIPTDMLQFAAPFKEHVHSVRVVRPCTPLGPSNPARTPAEYMVLLRMDSQASADDFFLQCNGKRFNSLEEATCRVVFVAEVTFDLHSPAAAAGAALGASPAVPTPFALTPSTFDGSINATVAATSMARSDSSGSFTVGGDPPTSTSVHPTVRFSPVMKPTRGDGAGVVAMGTIAASGAGSGTGAAGTPVAALSPDASASEHDASTCVICMERMESRVLMTVCNHSFHMECLVKWQDSPCPVCRFHHNNASESSTCQECQATDNLWVCLICGSVLCGSRHEKHVRGHYNSSLHAYAIEIETQQVWDFAGDGFVHRLIHNKADGKLVEISDPGQTSEERPQVPASLSDIQEERLIHGKLEGLAYQFNTLLTSQLNEQRHFYQKQARLTQRDLARPLGSLSSAPSLSNAAKLNGLLEQQEKDRRDRRSKMVSGADLIAALRQQRRELESKCASATERLRKMREETAFLQEVNQSLEANKEQWSIDLKRAQEGLASARTTLEKEVPKRERKVAQLMLKLDAASATTADSGCISSGGIAASIGASQDSDGAARTSTRGSTPENGDADRATAACPQGVEGMIERGGGTEETKGAAPWGGGLSCESVTARAARKGATPDEDSKGTGPAEGMGAVLAPASASAGATSTGGSKKRGRRKKCK